MAFFNKASVKDWLDQIFGTASVKDNIDTDKVNALAIRDIAMYTAVGLIADLISECEIQVRDHGKPVKDGTWYTFNVSANPNQTSQQVLARWVIDYYYEGIGLMLPMTKHIYNADKGFSIDEYPVKGDVYGNIFIKGYQINKTFRADNSYVLKEEGPGVRKLIDRACADYLDLLYYSKKSYVQNSGEKYELQIGAYPNGDPEKQKTYTEKVKNSMSSFMDSSSSVYIATKDQKLTRLSAANNTSSPSGYMSTREDIYDIVASVLHLPAGLFSGSNTAVDQILNEALTMAIDPLAKKMSKELTRKTFTQAEITDDDRRIVVDTTSIKHIEAVDMADKIDKLISSGIMSIDEAREECNMTTLDEDWSQKHYITKNYGEVDTPEGGETNE